MSDKDSKLIFEAYKNLLNENPLALTGVGLGVLEAVFMSLGLVGLAKLINQLDINSFSQVAPTQASVLETLDEAIKDFEAAIESNDPDGVKLKTEQVLLLFNDIDSPLSPLLKSISSVLLESIDSYYATGEDFYLAAASVSVGAGLNKAIQAISQTIAGISEIPANEKRYVLSTLNEINIKINQVTTSSQQILDDLKVEMARKVAPDPRLPSRYAGTTPSGSPKSPKWDKTKEMAQKAGKAAVELGKKGAVGAARLGGKLTKKAINFAASRPWKFWLQLPLIITSLITTLAILFRYGKVGNIVDNGLGMVEDVTETGKIITAGAKDITKETDTTIRTSGGLIGSLWSSIGDGISNQYNKITNYWSEYFFGNGEKTETQETSPVAQPSPTPEPPIKVNANPPKEEVKSTLLNLFPTK